MTTREVPCKRPVVTVELAAMSLTGLYAARCEVTGCGWSCGPSVKTHCEQMATWHRADHRRAVPKTRVVHDGEWDAHCDPCGGHRRTFATRRQASEWLDEHLVSEHGLVA